MEKSTIIILISVLVLLAAFLLHNYVFSIYETKIEMSRTQLFADGISELEITATPVNGLGFPAPFRNSNTTFVIEEGKKLVEITMLNEKSGKLRLRAKFTPGKVIVLVKPKYALFPTRVEILVEMNVA